MENGPVGGKPSGAPKATQNVRQKEKRVVHKSFTFLKLLLKKTRLNGQNDGFKSV